MTSTSCDAVVKCSAGNSPSYRSCYVVLPVHIVMYTQFASLLGVIAPKVYRASLSLYLN